MCFFIVILGGVKMEIYRNVHVQSFKDTKIYIMENMNEYWSEKKKFLSKKQIKLINKIAYEMTDEEGKNGFQKDSTSISVIELIMRFVNATIKL